MNLGIVGASGYWGRRLLKAAVSFDGIQVVHEQVRRLLAALEDAPKSSGWRLRARLGERKRWYELPEEAR